MKTWKLYLTSSFLIVLIAALNSCGKSDARTETSRLSAQGLQAVNVRVQEIKPVAITDVLQVAGFVKAHEDIMLGPEEGGVVKEWKVRKGQGVRKGDLLALLKDDLLRASYDAAAAQQKLAQLNYEKQEKVYSEQGISELQIKSLEYGRDAARAQADLVKARLDHTQLRSPIDGILDDIMTDVGEFAPPAMPIAHIVNIHRVKISAEVPERYAGTISVGMLAIVTVDAFPGDTLKGKVWYVGSTVSPANRALSIELVVVNPQRKLKPEMVAKVRLLRSARSNSLLLSEEVVQLVDRNRLIVYVEKDGKAEERLVRIGGRRGRLVEVVEGLKAGDRVIVVGFQKLVNGQPVIVTG